MQTVVVIVENAEKNLSAYIEGVPIVCVGNDIHEIERNSKEAIKLYIEACKQSGIEPVRMLQGEYKLKFKIDTATFIDNYSSISTKADSDVLQELTNDNCGIAQKECVQRKEQKEKIQKA